MSNPSDRAIPFANPTPWQGYLEDVIQYGKACLRRVDMIDKYMAEAEAGAVL